MAALDLLFVLGQVLVLLSLVYFFYLVIRWQVDFTAFKATGHYPEPHQSEAPATQVVEDAGHTRHGEIAAA